MMPEPEQPWGDDLQALYRDVKAQLAAEYDDNDLADKWASEAVEQLAVVRAIARAVAIEGRRDPPAVRPGGEEPPRSGRTRNLGVLRRPDGVDAGVPCRPHASA
jgi:hypothetical protein